MRGIVILFSLYFSIVNLFIEETLSYDFLVLEPQTQYNNLEKNVAVKIYYELDEIDDIIESLGSPKYEIGRGFLLITGTSVIHTLNGLAKGGYSVVGYARDGSSMDRWTLQRNEEKIEL